MTRNRILTNASSQYIPVLPLKLEKMSSLILPSNPSNMKIYIKEILKKYFTKVFYEEKLLKSYQQQHMVVANGVDGCPGHSSETEIKILGNQRRNDCQFEKTNRTSSDQLKTSEVKSQDQMGSVLVALLASGAITVIFVGVASLWCRKRLNRNVQRLRFLINPVRRSSGKTRSSWEENELYVIDHYEISHKQLIVGKEIGKGAFGKVCIAALLPRKNTVAVKYLREHPSEQEKEDFLREITLMKTTGRHPNVIHMLACCTLQQPLCMVMEFIEYGDLLKYLRTLRSEYEKVTIAGIIFNSRQPNHSMQSITKINSPNGIDSLPLSISDSTKNTEGSDSSTVTQTNPSDCSEMTAETRVYEGDNESFSRRHVLDSKQLINFAMQIASGMNHLGVKEIVHRDLAARNVLIGLDKVLKISDFGLSRTGVYVTRRGGRVPLRWLSIEAIRDNLYSTQSDVWAFGVVLWEICTLGGFPYSSVADKDVYKFLLSGRRLERPAQCSDKLYDVMMQCWDADPNARPTFQQLLHILGGMEREPHEYVNFDSKNGFISMCPTEEIV